MSALAELATLAAAGAGILALTIYAGGVAVLGAAARSVARDEGVPAGVLGGATVLLWPVLLVLLVVPLLARIAARARQGRSAAP
jgi:hypothetical protein